MLVAREKKTTTKSNGAGGNVAGPERAKAAELARKAILAKTKQKPVAMNLSPQPCVSTGSSIIDDLIGGTLALDGTGPVCPGFPRGCITEVYGAESSGKTTAALQAIAAVQKQGGLAMFLDFEHALHHGYAKNIGVSFDDDKLLLYSPTTFEEGMKMLYIGLKVGVDLIVVDSVASMVPAEEMEKGVDDAARIGALARAMSNLLPKLVVWLKEPAHSSNPNGTAVVFINQNRALINTGGGKGGDTNTSGGKALKYFVWLRLQFTKIRAEAIEVKDRLSGKKRRQPFGNHTQVKVTKSKIDAKQGHTSDIFIRYGQGIDDFYSIIEAAVAHKIVRREGAWYTFDEQRFQGREPFRLFLKDNPTVFDTLRSRVLAEVRAGAQDSPLDEIDEESIIESSLDEEFGESDQAVVEEIIESTDD